MPEKKISKGQVERIALWDRVSLSVLLYLPVCLSVLTPYVHQGFRDMGTSSSIIDHDSLWFHWNQDVCVCVSPALSITELIVVEAKGSSCRGGCKLLKADRERQERERDGSW